MNKDELKEKVIVFSNNAKNNLCYNIQIKYKECML